MVLATAIACWWAERNHADLFFDTTIEEERKPQTLYINGYQILEGETMWVVGDYLKKRNR
jgi:hypothetical protein